MALTFNLPTWLKPILYFVLIVIILGTVWEGYKLLASPDGKYLVGTAQVRVGDERVPGPLCDSVGLCEIELPIRGGDRAMPHIKDMVTTLFDPPQRNSEVFLIQILFWASLFTLQEAIAGFLIGGILGFILGVVFAHSNLLGARLIAVCGCLPNRAAVSHRPDGGHLAGW